MAPLRRTDEDRAWTCEDDMQANITDLDIRSFKSRPGAP
jgi:hypothetical protein